MKNVPFFVLKERFFHRKSKKTYIIFALFIFFSLKYNLATSFPVAKHLIIFQIQSLFRCGRILLQHPLRTVRVLPVPVLRSRLLHR